MREEGRKKIKLSICPYCKKKFIDRKFLTLHIGYIHNDENNPFSDEDIKKGNIIWECLNCFKVLPKPVLASELEQLQKNHIQFSSRQECIYPSKFFCSEDCRFQYQKGNDKKVGTGYDTAPFGEQYDWNR